MSLSDEELLAVFYKGRDEYIPTMVQRIRAVIAAEKESNCVSSKERIKRAVRSADCPAANGEPCQLLCYGNCKLLAALEPKP